MLSSSGRISSRGPGTEGAARQRDALVAEGVEVRESRSGEWSVRWAECGWFPQEVNLDLNEPYLGAEVVGDDEAAQVAQPGSDGDLETVEDQD